MPICHIVGSHMSRLNFKVGFVTILFKSLKTYSVNMKGEKAHNTHKNG